MVRCLLCDKTFKTERGLSIHLSRTHAVHGFHGRLSLQTIEKFFPLLAKKRWAKAEKLLEGVEENEDVDEWVEGYLHALMGMICSLRVSYSNPEPYIVKLDDFNIEELRKVKEEFSAFSNKLSNKNDFDAAYFKAWEDFTQYRINRKNDE